MADGAWEPPFEYETYEDADGYCHRRRVLLPNGHRSGTALRSRVQYAGADYWSEDTWQTLEAFFATDAPDMTLRERIRQPLFSYLGWVMPGGRLTLVKYPDGRIEEEWSAPETDRVVHVRWPRVRRHVDSLERTARAVIELASLLEPDDPDYRERGERKRALRFMLDAIGPGPARNLPPGSLIPVANDVRFANDFHNRVVPCLLELVPALQRFADAATKARNELPRARPGAKGHRNVLRLLVTDLATVYKERRGEWPSVYPNRDDDGYGGDFYRIFDTMRAGLPSIPDTFMTAGDLGKQLMRALKAARAFVKPLGSLV